MTEMTILAKLVDDPSRERGRPCSPWRIVIGDMIGAWSLELDRFFDKIPVTIYHLSSHSSDSWSCQILYFQLGDELLSSSRHFSLRDGREPLLACKFKEVPIVEQCYLVGDWLLEDLLYCLCRVSEESSIGVRACDGHRVRSDFSPPVGSHNPVRIYERKFGMLR